MNIYGKFIKCNEPGARLLDGSAGENINVVVPSALAGAFTLVDWNGSTLLTVAAGQTGLFSVVGKKYGIGYAFGNAADAGGAFVGFTPA